MDRFQEKALMEGFMAKAALPAPERSLASDKSRGIADKCFKNSNVLIVAEPHDMTNNKYLADNPAFFDGVNAKGGKYVFAEFPVEINGLVGNFMAGNISKPQFINEYLKFGYEATSGDSRQELAKQTAAFCETAKNSGLNVIASDFRFIRGKGISSDAYGIPDIQNSNDMVRKVTMAALGDLKLYNGHDYVMNHSDHEAFSAFHYSAIHSLSAEDRAQLDADIQERTDMATLWEPDDRNNCKYQNMLQFDLFQRLVEPGGSAMFFGGWDHFTGDDDMSRLMQGRGYGHPAKVLLLSDAGMFANKFTISVTGASYSPWFDYTINSETGRLVGENGELMPENAEKPAPAVTVPKQEGSFFKLPSLLDKVFN